MGVTPIMHPVTPVRRCLSSLKISNTNQPKREWEERHIACRTQELLNARVPTDRVGKHYHSQRNPHERGKEGKLLIRDHQPERDRHDHECQQTKSEDHRDQGPAHSLVVIFRPTHPNRQADRGLVPLGLLVLLPGRQERMECINQTQDHPSQDSSPHAAECAERGNGTFIVGIFLCAPNFQYGWILVFYSGLRCVTLGIGGV